MKVSIERINLDAQVIMQSIYLDEEVKEALQDGHARYYKDFREQQHVEFVVIDGGKTN